MNFAKLIYMSVFDHALKTFGNSANAEQWIHSVVYGLGYRRPIDMIGDVEGYKAVITLLVRIDHGIYC